MKSEVPNYFRSIFRYGIGILLGGVLLYFALRDISLDTLADQLANVHYEWILAGSIAALGSHWLRGYRWKMLFEATGAFNLSTTHAFWAVMVGYMVNNAFPRLGEVTRCSILLKSNNIPLAISAGTVLVERAIDLISLLLLIFLLLILELNNIRNIILLNIQSIDYISYQNFIFFFLALVVFTIFLAYGIYRYRDSLRKIKLFDRVYVFLISLLQAVASTKRIRNPTAFVLTTVLIWLGYILAIYFVFLALPQYSEYPTLNLYFAFIVTVVSGIAMTLPVPGGIGTFHSAVKMTFWAYGISNGLGEITAIIAHTTENLILNTIFGLIGYFYLLFGSRQK
ncbi:MAG: lysylphosphatidylglycerol synthase transmembrane domain-containing protein [Bacteroidia bacterium]|nr:flippase-like domain-containing protein [Bacteroidia bacterium]MDW8159116.1 lysylphosphatidylglycerol synthase transmembrane domain-containing protein [Bacteroidia bacterium]